MQGTAKTYWYNLMGKPHIFEIGRVQTTDYHPTRVTNFFIFGLVNSGERSIKVGKERLVIQAGEFFLLPPGIPHSGIRLDTHDAFFVHFEQKYQVIRQGPQLTTSNLYLPITGSIPAHLHLEDLMEHLYRIYSAQKIDEGILDLHFQSILAFVCEYQQSLVNKADKNIALAEQINDYTLKNVEKNLYSTDFENKFKLTYKTLNNIFASVYGVTIKQNVLKKKIACASHLLISGYSISEVVAKLNYSDYFYFLKVFKKIKGVTPKKYLEIYFGK